MKVYKNGICREIDQKREQEFREKGYTIEGKTTTDTVEVLKQEKEALKAENEALKAHTGGEENADTGGEIGETKTATRGRKQRKRQYVVICAR